MENNTVSFRNFTSYRLKEPLSTPGNSPFTSGIYTHASGKEAVAVSYDYKRRDSYYKMLNRDAELLTLISEKQAKRKSVTVKTPQVFTVIDKANRIILIREYIKGVLLTRVSQRAKVSAYQEAIQELARIGRSLTPEEATHIPRLTRRRMNRTFLWHIARAFFADRWLLPALVKLTYVYFKYAPPREPGTLELTSLSLGAHDIVCGPEQIYITSLRSAQLCEPGSGAALFPQLYYRDVGNDTMKHYLDTQVDTAHAKRSFLRLAAYYAAVQGDLEYIQVLAHSIMPYVMASMRANAPARSLSMIGSKKS